MEVKTPDYGSPSRESTFTRAAELFRERNGKLIIETGSAWYTPQGNSTYHLAKLAHECDAQFVSVDRTAEHVESARKLIEPFTFKPVTIVQEDSVLFLSRWDGDSIDYLYLDSMDYDMQAPLVSKLHSVAEMGAAYGKLSPQAIVLLDDWNTGHDETLKGDYTRQFLLYRGWKIVVEGNQLLLSR